MKCNHPEISAIQMLLVQTIGAKRQDLTLNVLRGAIEDRCRITHTHNDKEYLDLLLKSPEELQALIELVVISETWFFRDREMYPFLLRSMQNANRVCRILSMPCSTGEEPYSVVISFALARIPASSYEIEAIDISYKAIEEAKKGKYNAHSFRGDYQDIRSRFFEWDAMKSVYVLKQIIRDQVMFRQGNIFDERCIAMLGLYDIILCKNLLIYLNSKARVELMKILEKKLAPGGILIVSPAEVQIAKSAGFMPINETQLFALHKNKPLVQPIMPPIPQSIHIPEEPLSKHLLREALALADQGLLEQAEHKCKMFLRVKGSDAEAYFILGSIEHARNQFSTAEEYFLKTIELNPNHYEALIYLALIAEARGEILRSTIFRERAKKAEGHPHDQ